MVGEPQVPDILLLVTRTSVHSLHRLVVNQFSFGSRPFIGCQLSRWLAPHFWRMAILFTGWLSFHLRCEKVEIIDSLGVEL